MVGPQALQTQITQWTLTLVILRMRPLVIVKMSRGASCIKSNTNQTVYTIDLDLERVGQESVDDGTDVVVVVVAAAGAADSVNCCCCIQWNSDY